MAKARVQRNLAQAPPGAPEPDYCKQVNGVVRINLTGESLKLEGFGYPTAGFAVQFADKPDPVPVHPVASSGLSVTEEINIDSATGAWTCRLLDSCDDNLVTERTVIVWYKYETDVELYWLIEVFKITIPICGDLAAC